MAHTYCHAFRRSLEERIEAGQTRQDKLDTRRENKTANKRITRNALAAYYEDRV